MPFYANVNILGLQTKFYIDFDVFKFNFHCNWWLCEECIMGVWMWVFEGVCSVLVHVCVVDVGWCAAVWFINCVGWNGGCKWTVYM